MESLEVGRTGPGGSAGKRPRRDVDAGLVVGGGPADPVEPIEGERAEERLLIGAEATGEVLLHLEDGLRGLQLELGPDRDERVDANRPGAVAIDVEEGAGPEPREEPGKQDGRSDSDRHHRG